jgi:hypothetical protein
LATDPVFKVLFLAVTGIFPFNTVRPTVAVVQFIAEKHDEDQALIQCVTGGNGQSMWLFTQHVMLQLINGHVLLYIS